jgi:FtsP/CotA-like multicopper oxidase with cupredoxin domain
VLKTPIPSRLIFGAFIVFLFCSLPPVLRAASNRTTSAIGAGKGCPPETQGGILLEPASRISKNGILKLSLFVRSSTDALGHVHYCYFDELGNLDPTLRVAPGDTLIVRLKNEISLPASVAKKYKAELRKNRNPCSGGIMSEFATNLHFHGLTLPPICHEDETIKTLIEPGDPPFEYRVKIPPSQPPGLYWYHPHVHGFSEEQLLGGASGAIVVEGIEKAVPRVAGLPERVFVIRDELMPDPTPSETPNPNRPTKQLSINHIVVPYPKYRTPQIEMKPLERQFWRVLNASADTYLYLRMEYEGKRQSFDMVALDGVPLHYGDPGAQTYAPQQMDIFLPPATRAEFVVKAPPAGVSGTMQTSSVFRGAADDDRPVLPTGNQPPALRMGQDDVDPARPLLSIVSAVNAATPPGMLPLATDLQRPSKSLSGIRAVRKRLLYFSEELVDPRDPKSATRFFITEEGHVPMVFDPVKMEPSITVHQGDVEDWTVENRSREVHTFHIHQIHFLVVGSRGAGWEEPTLRDTVNIPAWSGFGEYPRLVLRMDFRDADVAGIIPFHCHIAQHLDGGMMAVVRVEPASGQ